MPVCAQCGQENPDIAKSWLAWGAPLAAPEPPAEERKPITVLFCDIVGSTAKAEHMDPEDVCARASRRTRHGSAPRLERSGRSGWAGTAHSSHSEGHRS
jgi:class 3 adenylate cyclase